MSDDYYQDMAIAAAYDAECVAQAVTIEDIPFYVDLAKKAGQFPLSEVGEGVRGRGSVLELGCGTGRVTIPIAKAGVEVTGLDSSLEMLDVARAKSAGIENVRWVQSDMANFELDQRFGLVIIPFRSFSLLLTVAEQQACLRRIHDHLLPGGRLALNFFNPDLALMASWLTDKRDLWQKERASIERQRELWTKRRLSTAEQRVEGEDARLEPSDTGAVIARIERNLRLRYVFRYEMEHLLALNGFEVQALYGWFDRRPFDDESSEMVWIAGKPAQR